ncbi:sulfur carrier protein ThiS [Desulfovibrio sp. OttesenSCG-928-C06]|nr:sulfur carrier protein ThiS [Desulfovibrio sp. OttesenSCG-928-C06]
MSEISITVNGQPETCPHSLSLEDYLAGKGINPHKVVAELNGEILKPQSFKERILNAGDEVEIIHFVGGG